MKQIASSTALRGSHPARTILLATLTLIAVLFCLLSAPSIAAHAVGAEHGMAAPTAASAPVAASAPAAVSAPAVESAPAGPSALARAAAFAGPTMRLAGAANQPTVCYENDSPGGAGNMAACDAPLAVVSTVLLAQLPSVSDLSVASTEFTVDPYRAVPAHLYRPSLTLLSISRV